LQFLKSIPHMDFVDNKDNTLFDSVCVVDGKQVFESYGFRIDGGRFVDIKNNKKLNPRIRSQRNRMIDICMGRDHSVVKKQREHALGLCDLFAKIGEDVGVQYAMVEYAKLEFKTSLDIHRRPLKSVGGTIRCLLPDEVWGTPIPALFFNLCQNSPGGAYKLFRMAMLKAESDGLVVLRGDNGYMVIADHVGWQDDLLGIIWKMLNKSAYADWGFQSKQYLSSGKKNPPRIVNIKPAIKEFYGVDLPLYR